MSIKINDEVFESFPSLESKRLIFREFDYEDAMDLFTIRSNAEVMKHMDSYKHQSVKDAEELISSIKNTYKEKSGINWAIIEKPNNKFIGYFGYWRFMKEHCRAEIGYALNPNFWKQGYMKETFETLIDFGFNDLKIHSIEANVNPNNKISIQLLEKMNFKKEAYFRENYLFEGKFSDSIIYSLLEIDLK